MMITRNDFSPKKSRHLAKLESAWNGTMQPVNKPKRHLQMTKDIKKFVFQSIEANPNEAERRKMVKANGQKENIFEKISSTFNFVHHEGTDHKAELAVVKVILVREGQVMTLTHMCGKARTIDDVHNSTSSILEVLAELRESTLNYLEALCLWRQSEVDGNMRIPRVFYWEKQNYTLKIVTDLDFIADNAVLIEALNISASQFRSNPLMLTNNLDDPNTWMDPAERAAEDAGGVTQGELFQSRLRLRYAERMLLQEIELCGSDNGGGSDQDGVFLTENADQQPQGYGQFASKYQPQFVQQNPQLTVANFQSRSEQDPSFNSTGYIDNRSKDRDGGESGQHHHQQRERLIKGASALESDFDYEDEAVSSSRGGKVLLAPYVFFLF
jgi:hypothetical protein